MLSSLILHLQRLSTEDGPGLRTTVFFKGCSLRCPWCHNPESLSPAPQVQWLENRCIDCETCLGACPNGCLEMTERGIQVDRERCEGCGTCADACPSGALELLGRRVELDELAAELLKDRAYYEKSGGGVTASGGEPLLQPGFVAALGARLQAEGIPFALDTCGFCSPAALEQVIPAASLVLFDLKEIDPGRHQAFTGKPNARILENLLRTRDLLDGTPGARLWIRTPLIPGATARAENLLGIGAFIARNLDGRVERWELCAFNNLCRDKYRRLGLDWEYSCTPLLSRAELDELLALARQSGVDPQTVFATGAARQE